MIFSNKSLHEAGNHLQLRHGTQQRVQRAQMELVGEALQQNVQSFGLWPDEQSSRQEERKHITT